MDGGRPHGRDEVSLGEDRRARNAAARAAPPATTLSPKSRRHRSKASKRWHRPMPTSACARRLRPMMADTTFYRAIPGTDRSDAGWACGRRPRRSGRHLMTSASPPAGRWSRTGPSPAISYVPRSAQPSRIIAATRSSSAAAISPRRMASACRCTSRNRRCRRWSGPRKYGTTLVGHLHKLGLIGPNFTAAHAVWIDDDDMGGSPTPAPALRTIPAATEARLWARCGPQDARSGYYARSSEPTVACRPTIRTCSRRCEWRH